MSSTSGRGRGRPAQSDPQETRRQIVAAATTCFARHGFQGASISAVARLAGFSPPAIYHYFADKYELYEAVAADCVDRVWGRLLAAVEAHDNVAGQIEALFSATSSRGENDVSLVLLSMPVEAAWEPRFRPLLEHRAKRQMEVFAIVEATARRAGDLPRITATTGSLAEILRMLFRGWALDAYSEPAHRAARSAAVAELLAALGAD